MGSESPNAVLYDSAGNALAVTPGSAIPASNSALLLAGTDGTNARTISVDTSGRTVLVGAGTAGTPAGGVISIQGVSGGQALPTTISGTVTVTGTVTATNPSVSTTAAAVPASATYIGGAVQAVQSGLTLGDLYPLSMTQTGLLRVDGSNVTQPVSIATSVTVIQPTAASLNATVTGTVAATQSGTWTVQPGNTANTTPWLATINQGGNSVGVTAASTAAVATQPSLVTSFSPNSQLPTGTNIIGITTPVNDDTATGTLTATAQTQAFLVNSGRSSISWQFTGTWTGTINFEKSLDGANWVPMAFYTGTDTTNSTTVNGIYYSSLGSTQNVRIRTSGVWTGTVTWTVARSVGVKAVGIQDSIPSGTNTIGAVNQASAPWSITNSDVTATGALGALNAAVQVNTAGLDTAGFQLAAGTLIGTIIPEVSFDAGTTWNATYFDTAASGKVATIVFASANTATAATIVGVGGSGLSRVRVSAYTSGTANITVRATTRTDPSVLFAGPVAVAGPPATAQIGGSVTTAAPVYTTGTLNNLSLTTAGALRVEASNTIKPLYGSSGQTITITLASLTTGSSRASTAVSNTTNLYEDALLFIKLTTAATGVAATGYVNVYGYGSVDGGTTYPEAITGTDAAATLTVPPNLVLLAQINANTSAATKTYGPFSFCRQYGLDKLPAQWGVVIQNETGATFNATAGNFLVEYQGINGQLV